MGLKMTKEKVKQDIIDAFEITKQLKIHNLAEISHSTPEMKRLLIDIARLIGEERRGTNNQPEPEQEIPRKINEKETPVIKNPGPNYVSIKGHK